ncbi:MAG TPA: hypothetical protein VJK04_00625 [Candidatus Paceibacterota bacterium]
MEGIRENFPKSKNPIKSEHLKEGVGAITACVGTPDQFRDPKDPTRRSSIEIMQNELEAHNIDFYGEPKGLAKNNVKNAGGGSYVISLIDNKDKFSNGFKNCTGLVVTGIEKQTGRNISFLSHQYPLYFLGNDDNRVRFTRDLEERLEELKGKCADKTIDAVIIGGNASIWSLRYQKEYSESIKLLSEEVRKTLGFEPVAITGPKTDEGTDEDMMFTDDVFYDNARRRLYIMRPVVGNATTKSYLPSDLENQRKKWGI